MMKDIQQSTRRPTSMQVVVALQALTLVAVLAGQPLASDASARPARENPLPNSAAQRAAMIDLLGDIRDELRQQSEADKQAQARSDERHRETVEAFNAITRALQEAQE
jgi:hypothetical protein